MWSTARRVRPLRPRIATSATKQDPGKYAAVSRKDHAQSKTQSAMTVQPDLIALKAGNNQSFHCGVR